MTSKTSGGGVDSRYQVPTADAPRIVTRQQLRDPAFFAKVKAGLLDGTITPIDDRVTDLVDAAGQAVPADSPAGRALLTQLQATWDPGA